MIKVRTKGLKKYFEPKTGKTYYYHRKTHTRIHAPEGSARFLEEFAAAEARLVARPSAKPGSLKLVIEHYRGSHEFLGLQSATRKEYDRIINHLSIIDTLVMAELNPPDIVRIRDNLYKKRNRSFANKTLAILSILFSYAIERGFANSNPVKQVKKLRRRNDSGRKNRPWSRVELDNVISRAPPHIALPLMIGRWTGLRESDVLQLQKSAFDGQAIRHLTAKRNVWVTIPVASKLIFALGNRPRQDVATICANSRGQSWTSDGFKTSFFKFIRKLETEGIVSKGLTFHGLRHTVATELRELGFDNRTIADMLGQKSENMAAHYSRDADLHDKLKPAVEQMEIAEETRTNLSRKSEKNV